VPEFARSTTGERVNGMRGGMPRECGYDDAGENPAKP
jgi:hypothetical protein